jgi:hypothetical protein
MLDKARLGTRYTCFTCGTKFYDLNKPVPACPECGADQREAPVRDVKALLSKGGRRRAPKVDLDDEPGGFSDDEEGDEEGGDDDDDDLGLLGDDDDDSPDDDEDMD